MFKVTSLLTHPIQQQEQLRRTIEVQPHWPDELKAYLAQPLADKSSLLKSLNYVVLDFETTGVDPDQDRILTMGALPIEGIRINLQQGQAWLINHGSHIRAATAVVNHIVPSMLRDGDSIHLAMQQLLKVITGKVVVVHGKIIEQQFIDAYFAHAYGINQLPCIWLDTLLIEKNHTFQSDRKANCSWQLADVRARYGLPSYPDHHAMVDTLACAELFLAQQHRIFKAKLAQAQLKALYC